MVSKSATAVVEDGDDDGDDDDDDLSQPNKLYYL